MSILDAIPGVGQAKLIGAGVLLAVVLAFGGWVYYEHYEVGKLSAQNAVLVANNKELTNNASILTKNYNLCAAANGINETTINQLKTERDQAEAAIADLAKKQKESGKKLSDLQIKLNAMAKDSKNNGTLSPYLRETIRGIEALGNNQ